MTLTPQSVFDEYEDRLEQLRSVNGSLAADLIEERQQRREVAAALVRVTEERDELTGAIDRLRQRAIEHDERHQKIFAEWLRERAQLIAERDEARDEVVRLGRELEQWKQAFGEDGLRVAKARLLDALGRSRRPWTDDQVTVREDGTRSTCVHVKRACNGCGELLGDVTDEEMDRAVAGLPAEDVRGECLACSPLPSPAVSVDALSREVVRLRTIIVELREAAEPEEQIEALRPGDAGFDEWLLGQPGGSE